MMYYLLEEIGTENLFSCGFFIFSSIQPMNFSSLTVYTYLFYFDYQFVHIYFLKYVSKCVIIIDRCSTPATSKTYIFVTEAVISFKLQLCPWQLKQLGCECIHVCQLPTFRLTSNFPAGLLFRNVLFVNRDRGPMRNLEDAWLQTIFGSYYNFEAYNSCFYDFYEKQQK